MSGLRFDAEFEAATKMVAGPKSPQINTDLEIRDFSNNFYKTIMKHYPRSGDIERTTFSVQSYDGAEISVTRFTSQIAINSANPLPAVMFLHGGAMVAGSVDISAPQIAYLASQTGFPFFGVEYRLAPEHPAPAAIEDSFASLNWISSHSAGLNIDASKIAVMGDSAGGLLSVSTALVARDRHLSPPLAKQILIYPTINDATSIAEDNPLNNFLTWQASDNAVIWKAYLGGDKDGQGEIPTYAVPGRVQVLKGLPPMYLDIGTLDLFLDESLEYAIRLAQAGVEVEVHVLPGLPHGWEMAGEISWFKTANNSRIRAIKRLI